MIPLRRLRSFCFRHYLRLVRNRRVVCTIEGVTYDLDLGEMIDVGIYLRQYERDIVRLIHHLCKPGQSILDIGANIGAHTLRFAKVVGDTGQVWAFEPTDYAFNKLTRNVLLNPFTNVTALQCALGDKDLPRQQVAFRSSWRTDGRQALEPGIVDCLRLDTWCRQHQHPKVDLIKLDVDGLEYEVLHGAEELLARNAPLLLIEASGYQSSTPPRNPFYFLSEHGYRFWDTKSEQPYGHPQEILDRFRDPSTAPDSINVVAVASDTRPFPVAD
jgi:FkbM family methyltransferase